MRLWVIALCIVQVLEQGKRIPYLPIPYFRYFPLLCRARECPREQLHEIIRRSLSALSQSMSEWKREEEGDSRLRGDASWARE